MKFHPKLKGSASDCKDVVLVRCWLIGSSLDGWCELTLGLWHVTTTQKDKKVLFSNVPSFFFKCFFCVLKTGWKSWNGILWTYITYIQNSSEPVFSCNIPWPGLFQALLVFQTKKHRWTRSFLPSSKKAWNAIHFARMLQVKFKHQLLVCPTGRKVQSFVHVLKALPQAKVGAPVSKWAEAFEKWGPQGQTTALAQTSCQKHMIIWLYMCGRRLESVVSTWYLHFESQIHLRVGNREFQVQQVTFQWSIYWWASQNRRCCREKIIGIGGVCDLSRVKSVTICPGASPFSLGRGVGVLYKPSKTNMNHSPKIAALYMGVSLNGGTPKTPQHPKMVIFSRKTHG